MSYSTFHVYVETSHLFAMGRRRDFDSFPLANTAASDISFVMTGPGFIAWRKLLCELTIVVGPHCKLQLQPFNSVGCYN